MLKQAYSFNTINSSLKIITLLLYSVYSTSYTIPLFQSEFYSIN